VGHARNPERTAEWGDQDINSAMEEKKGSSGLQNSKRVIEIDSIANQVEEDNTGEKAKMCAYDPQGGKGARVGRFD